MFIFFYQSYTLFLSLYLPSMFFLVKASEYANINDDLIFALGNKICLTKAAIILVRYKLVKREE